MGLKSYLVLQNKQFNHMDSRPFLHYILLNILSTYTLSCLQKAGCGG